MCTIIVYHFDCITILTLRSDLYTQTLYKIPLSINHKNARILLEPDEGDSITLFSCYKPL